MSLLRHLVSLVLLLAVAWVQPAFAQEGGSSHTGDVFGDLVHIKRDVQTGQPILQKRWVALEEDTFGWAYCPIPVDVFNLEIPFAADSCDVDPTQLDRLVELDYFGRLSGGRTRERNIRMHFDEAISGMQAAELISTEETGRISLGTGCVGTTCTSWRVIDSPLENLAIYNRLLRYGHLQTDPLEEDVDAHGDPEAGTVYHPALAAADWAKFTGAAAALLPRSNANACFSGTTFVAECAAPQSLTSADFHFAATFLAGASDKTGKITIDLVQYMNRILGITVATAQTAATLDTLLPLIRDADGNILPATAGMPAPADERFVNFGASAYSRADIFTRPVTALVDQGGGVWRTTTGVSLLDFLRFVNGAASSGTNAAGFVLNAHDAVRAIEFVHEYAVPADLRAEEGAATTMTVPPASAATSATPQIVPLHAIISDSTTVNGGTVTFTVRTQAGTQVGVPVTSAPVANGTATASFILPADTPVQLLVVTAAFSGAPGFAAAVATSTLTITLVDACAGVLAPTTAEALPTGGSATVTLTIGASCAWTAAADAAWLLVSTTAGTGPAAIEYIAERNLTGLTRVGHVIVANQLLTVTQPAMPLLTTDFTGDGRADMLWQHSAGTLVLWTLNGLQLNTWSYLTPAGVSDPDWRAVDVADFNHDGAPDLLWYHRLTGSVGVWLMQGTTAAAGITILPTSDLGLRLVTSADMNHDGWSDLVWQHRGDGHVVVTHLQGTSVTTTREIPAPAGGVEWTLMDAADVNHDESPDLLWKHTVDGRIVFTMMQAGTVLSTETLSLVVTDPDWLVVSAADLNADGSVDLMWQNTTTGIAGVWWMTGLERTGWTMVEPASGADWAIVSIR